MRTYATRNEAIAREIVSPLLASALRITDDQVEMLAQHVIEFDGGNFSASIDPEDFWAAVWEIL